MNAMSSTFRKHLTTIHTWTGLTAGLVIVLLAVTGAAMVLRPQLDDIVNRDLLVVPQCKERLPLDALIAKAVGAHGPGKLRSVEIEADAEASTAFQFADRDNVYVDPCSGAVLGVQNQYGGFFGFNDYLHRFRFMEGGRQTAGWFNVAFVLLLTVGGLVIWWPRTRLALKSALRFNPRLPGSAKTLSLHKVVGLYTSLLVLLITITGIPISFVPVRDAIYAAAGGPPNESAPRSKPAAGAARLPMETLWQRAQAAVPNHEWMSLRFPDKPADAVQVEVREHGAPHVNAKSQLYLDAYSGDTLALRKYATDISLGRKIYLYIIALHAGLVGGLAYQLALLIAALAIPVQAYSGIVPWFRRKFGTTESSLLPVKIARIRDEAADIKSFELVSASGKPLPGFTPGSHVNVKIDGEFTRQYSLCNDPSDRSRYLIAVKRVADSRGGSRAMHDRTGEGDVIHVSPPRNHFPLEPKANHHLLLAGGIGITPLLAMARYLQRTKASFELHYFTRSIEHTAFHELLSHPDFHGKVHFHYAIEPDRLHDTLHHILWQRPQGAHLYVCGPRPFMDLVEQTAAPGWPPETIHVEHFSADPRAQAGPRLPFDVTLARSGGTFNVPADKSIAEVLSAHGVASITSCEQGVCGTCLTGVLGGTPDHRDVFLSDAEHKACDKMLICVSRAQSQRLVLDL
jgi:vanillate O-demethylase ferredoxin subunit